MKKHSDFQIDEMDLAKELLKQADLVYNYTEKTAAARKFMDLQKNRLDVVKAKLDLMIRKNPLKFGLSKITEGAVASTIIKHEWYIQAVADVAEAKYDYDILQGACNALEHKKHSLKELCYSHSQAFTSSYEDDDATDDMRKETARTRSRRRKAKNE